jgi:hypothetical protein
MEDQHDQQRRKRLSYYTSSTETLYRKILNISCFQLLTRSYELAYAGKMRKEDLLANEDGSFLCHCKLKEYTTVMSIQPSLMVGVI